MKKLVLILFILLLASASGQCLALVKSYFGLKTGINYAIFDPDDEAGNFTGVGLGIGLGLGIDILNTLDLEFAPSFRTTSFNRTVINIQHGANYTNFYLPFELKLKAGMLPVVNPYFGLGFAENIQLSGEAYIGEVKTEIDELENDLFLLFSLGADISFIKLKISPDFTFNLNLSADDPDTQNRSEKNYEINFAVGIYYTP
ncbi:MAG: outer membrane beta-barrel protein [candidate division WOR-3 bacterium]